MRKRLSDLMKLLSGQFVNGDLYGGTPPEASDWKQNDLSFVRSTCDGGCVSYTHNGTVVDGNNVPLAYFSVHMSGTVDTSGTAPAAKVIIEFANDNDDSPEGVLGCFAITMQDQKIYCRIESLGLPKGHGFTLSLFALFTMFKDVILTLNPYIHDFLHSGQASGQSVQELTCTGTSCCTPCPCCGEDKAGRRGGVYDRGLLTADYDASFHSDKGVTGVLFNVRFAADGDYSIPSIAVHVTLDDTGSVECKLASAGISEKIVADSTILRIQDLIDFIARNDVMIMSHLRS